jgi:hypothetical protein
MDFKMKPETEEAVRRREIVNYLTSRAYGDKQTAGRILFVEALLEQPIEKLVLMEKSARAEELHRAEKRRGGQPRQL